MASCGFSLCKNKFGSFCWAKNQIGNNTDMRIMEVRDEIGEDSVRMMIIIMDSLFILPDWGTLNRE